VDDVATFTVPAEASPGDDKQPPSPEGRGAGILLFPFYVATYYADTGETTWSSNFDETADVSCPLGNDTAIVAMEVKDWPFLVDSSLHVLWKETVAWEPERVEAFTRLLEGLLPHIGILRRKNVVGIVARDRETFRVVRNLIEIASKARGPFQPEQLGIVDGPPRQGKPRGISCEIGKEEGVAEAFWLLSNPTKPCPDAPTDAPDGASKN
jgi:hypothetical protein